ncbi:MAG: FkbM family methyltransferase [bacterium]
MRNIITKGNKENAEYDLDASFITKDSVIYSFGVGDDIAWDVGMIKKFGCEVHSFDMTPSSIEWVAKQKLPSKLHFHPYGISNFDGNALFHLRKKPHWKVFAASTSLYIKGNPQMLPVKTLRTIMKELGHDHIDVMKIDIEGEEYRVLKNIKGIPVKQIVIEMHTWTKSERIEKIITLFRLWWRGYRIINHMGHGTFTEYNFSL